MQTLASGFKGPADFCAMPDGDGLLVVPDLVESEFRIVHLARWRAKTPRAGIAPV